MRWTSILPAVLLAPPSFACLVFCVSDGEQVLAGNNEDYFVPDTRMWFVPAEAGKHGRVYFGYADGFPQGGLNDAGLFFDGLALDPQPVTGSPDLPAPPGNLADIAMAECERVEQVIELFELHDRRMFSRAQLFFADKSGDAAIIEGDAVIRKQGTHLVATNFRQSCTPRAEVSCERYEIASRLLDDAEAVSVDLCRRVLSATHQESPAATLYSNICDLERGLVYLYHFHDYETVVVIDLEAELAKGARVVEIASLFPRTFAYSTFVSQASEADAVLRERERDPSADASTFGDYVGQFRVDEGVAAGLEFDVVLDGDVLFVDLAKQGRFELVPRAEASFVCIQSGRRARFDFTRNEAGAVDAVTLRQDDLVIRVVKLE